MASWKSSISKRAVIAGFLSLVLMLSGVDMRGVALALDDTTSDATSELSLTYPLSISSLSTTSTDPTQLPLTVGSTTVEAASLTWITLDTEIQETGGDATADEDASKLELIPGYDPFDNYYIGDDAAVSLEARLQFTFSGENDYAPGTIQIAIPAQFIEDRTGSYIGSSAIDLPEEPDSSQDFAYRLVTPADGSDPYYVITNTRTLDSDATAVIDFSYNDITPHEVVSGALQSGLQAKLTLATADGSNLEVDTNELSATITTKEQLDSAYLNSGTVVDASEASDTVQAALDNVGSADDYVLVRWNTYASAKGNQSFTLTMNDQLSDTSEYPAVKNKTTNEVINPLGAVVLGTSTEAADPIGTSYTKTILDNGYIPTGETHYETVWTAYPKSLFQDGETYTLTNTATWTVTPTDDADSASARFKAASVTYTKPTATAFVEGSSYYNIAKTTLEPHKYSTSDNAALNELAADTDTTIGFTVAGSGEIMNQTKAADDTTPPIDIERDINEGTKTIDDYYHKRYVTVEAADDALYLNENYASELTSADYYISQVNLQDPYVYTYGITNVNGTEAWDYVLNTTGQLPDMALYGLSETEGGTASTWTKLASVSYSEANARTVTKKAEGVSVDGDTVVLDESLGITRVKLIASTKDYDKIRLSYSPFITLRADSDRIKALVAELFNVTDTPIATIRNDATLLAYNGDAVNGTDASIDPTNAKLTAEEQEAVIALTSNYTPSLEMFRTDDLDQLRYNGSMSHGTSLAYLHGIVPHIGVTSAKALTYDSARDLDSTAMQAKLHYTATVHEQSNITSRALYESYVAEGAIVPETSGTWYDLLPAGVEPVISSIALRDGDAIEDAYAIKNYKDSGRTLLVVKAKLTPVLKYNNAVATDSSDTGYWAKGFYDEPQISFDALYNYANFKAGADEKDQLVNVIAFESGNDALGNVEGLIGEKDDASKRETYNNKQTAAAVSGVEYEMTDLDTSLVDKKPTFVYARSDDRISIGRYATTSTKTVASDSEGVYRAGTGEEANQVNVYTSQGYTYRICVGSPYEISGIVIYDALESYEPSGQDPDSGIAGHTWKGELVSVDTSALKNAGVDPVVYYSTNESITSATIDAHIALNSTDWSTSAPDDLSEVTAVAIDCTHGNADNEFVLMDGESLPVYIHMKAPAESDSDGLFETCNSDGGEDDPDNNSHAFNNAYIFADDWGASTAYTKVGILPFEVEVSKFWDDEDNQDGKRPESVTVNLLANGKAAEDVDGNTVAAITLGAAKADESGYSNNGWTYTYDNLPYTDGENAIRYTVVEDAITESSVALYNPSYTRTDDAHLQITNKRTTDTVDVCGTKTWKDNNDAAGARPSTIQVRLYADGVYKTSKRVSGGSSDTWSYSFTGLPAHNGGKDIVYTIEEEAIDYYAVDYSASTKGSGSTVADDGTIEGSTDITNSYSTTGFLAIEKTVEGAKSDASKNASFSFVVELFDSSSDTDDSADRTPLYGSYPYTVLDSSDAIVSRGTIATGGTISLAGDQRAIIEDIPANSTYAVTERPTDGFTLSSSANTSGTVTAGTDKRHAAVASFTNTYSSSGSFQLGATKVLTGQKLARYAFQFQAYQVFNEGTSNEYEEIVSTASNIAGNSPDENNQSTGTVNFSRVNVTNDDLDDEGALELLYRIREVIPEDATDNGNGTYTYNGYTYAGNVEQVRVRLADIGDGTIAVTQTAETKSGTSRIKSGDTYTSSSFTSNGTATFNNAYEATGELELVAYKSLIGRDLAAEEFDFTLAPLTSGAPTTSTMTATNDADGTIRFPAIPLSSTDDGRSYIYKATEDAGDDTVNCTPEAIYYLVEAADDGAGAITSTTTVVAPIAGAAADKVAAGDPSVFEATGASPTFTNTLKPGSLSIKKALVDGVVDPTEGGTDFTFKVRLTGSDVADSYTYAVDGGTDETAMVTDGVLELTLKAGQTAIIDNIAAGTTYQVFEESAEGWQLSTQSGASGTIEAGTTSTATFTNKLASETAAVHLYASKTLDGEAPESNAFTFRLTGTSANAHMPAGSTDSATLNEGNDVAGLVDFGSIEYTQAGTYTYTIAEVAGDDGTVAYDASKWTAIVTVTSAEDGTLSASVSYQKGSDEASSMPPVFANTTNPGALEVTKNGINVTTANANAEFTFTVELMNDGKPVTSVSYRIADSEDPVSPESTTGIYQFTLTPGQTATFLNLPAGTTYTVSESDQPSGWTQTATPNMHGTVPANDTAAASTTSTYAATGSVSLRATKTMRSGSLAAGQFSFNLFDGYLEIDENGTILQTASNLEPANDALTGDILFDQIDFDVTDLLTDGTYEEKTFVYTIREVVPNKALNYDDTITWADADRETREAGGFKHNGVIYGDGSPLSQFVYVKVADAGNGKLQVTKVDEDGDETTELPDFTNTVGTGSLKVSVTAIGTNEATEDTEFKYSITLKSASGQPVSGSFPITYYDADGNKVTKVYPDGEQQGQEIWEVEFSDSGLAEGLTNIKSGEYFVLSNLPAGTTYEVVKTDSTYGFTQVASTNAAGTIKANEPVNEPVEASFTNAYAVDGEVSLGASVRVEDARTGAEKDGYTFTFQLYDEDNNLLQTKTSDSATGLVTFDPLGLTAADAGTEDNPKVHRYRIVEVNDSQKNITYDTHSGWVNVSVWDDGSDQAAELTVTVTYDHQAGDADAEPETFVNKYQVFSVLPFVGGSGLAPFGAIAIIVAALAGALYIRRWRRKE